MTRLKPLLMILPFIFAGLGAFVLAGMLTIQPESARLPFAYVTWSGDTQYDLHVMDVLSGEILFEVNSSEYDCPTSISPDGRWLIYGQIDNSPSNQQFRLLDLNSREIIDLPSHHRDIHSVDWENNYVGYWVKDDTTYTYQRYDLSTHTTEQIAMISSRLYPNHLRWYDGEVVSIVLNSDVRQLIVNRGTNDPMILQLSEGFVESVTLSADTRYLFYSVTPDYDTSISYVVDTITSETMLIVDAIWGFWQPTSNNLYYFNNDYNDDDDLIVYDVVSREVRTFILAETNSPETFVTNARWSLDNRYMAYTVQHAGGRISTRVFDILNGESVKIGRYILPDANNLIWVSTTQLVYPDAHTDYIEVNGQLQQPPKDLWMYDVTTGETTRLTNTPNMDEDVGCKWG